MIEVNLFNLAYNWCICPGRHDDWCCKYWALSVYCL